MSSTSKKNNSSKKHEIMTMFHGNSKVHKSKMPVSVLITGFSDEFNINDVYDPKANINPIGESFGSFKYVPRFLNNDNEIIYDTTAKQWQIKIDGGSKCIACCNSEIVSPLHCLDKPLWFYYGNNNEPIKDITINHDHKKIDSYQNEIINLFKDDACTILIDNVTGIYSKAINGIYDPVNNEGNIYYVKRSNNNFVIECYHQPNDSDAFQYQFKSRNDKKDDFIADITSAVPHPLHLMKSVEISVLNDDDIYVIQSLIKVTCDEKKIKKMDKIEKEYRASNCFHEDIESGINALKERLKHEKSDRVFDNDLALDEMKVQLMHNMVENVHIKWEGTEVNKKILYLTNRQASLVDSVSMKRCIDSLDIGNPKFVIILNGSVGSKTMMDISHEEKISKPETEYIAGEHLSSEISALDENIVETQILLFMTNAILPLAKQTNALIIVQGANDCILSASLSKVALAEQARLGKDCPFTVVALSMEFEVHYKAVLAKEKSSIASQLCIGSKGWKNRVPILNNLYYDKKDISEEERCDLTPAASRYIIFESRDKEGRETPTTLQLFRSSFIELLTKSLPSIAISSHKIKDGIGSLVELISRKIPVLLLDSTERAFTLTRAEKDEYSIKTELARKEVADQFPNVDDKDVIDLEIVDGAITLVGRDVLLDKAENMLEQKWETLIKRGTFDSLNASTLAFCHTVLTTGSEFNSNKPQSIPLYVKIEELQKFKRENKDSKTVLVPPELVTRMVEIILRRIPVFEDRAKLAVVNSWLGRTVIDMLDKTVKIVSDKLDKADNSSIFSEDVPKKLQAIISCLQNLQKNETSQQVVVKDSLSNGNLLEKDNPVIPNSTFKNMSLRDNNVEMLEVLKSCLQNLRVILIDKSDNIDKDSLREENLKRLEVTKTCLQNLKVILIDKSDKIDKELTLRDKAFGLIDGAFEYEKQLRVVCEKRKVLEEQELKEKSLDTDKHYKTNVPGSTHDFILLFELLSHPLTSSGSIHDVDKLKRKLLSVAKIDRMPPTKTLESLIAIQDCWDHFEIYSEIASSYKQLSKYAYITLLAIATFITVASVVESNQIPFSSRQPILIMSFISTAVVAYISYTNPAIRWQQLRMAALSIESNIWLFRTGAGVYRESSYDYMDKSIAVLNENIQEIKQIVLEGADIKSTAFYSTVKSKNLHNQHNPSTNNFGTLDEFDDHSKSSQIFSLPVKAKVQDDFNLILSELNNIKKQNEDRRKKKEERMTNNVSEGKGKILGYLSRRIGSNNRNSDRNSAKISDDKNDIENGISDEKLPRSTFVSKENNLREPKFASNNSPIVADTGHELEDLIDVITKDKNSVELNRIDNHYESCTPDMYIKFRIIQAIMYYKNKIPVCSRTRTISQLFIISGSIATAALAFLGMASWSPVVSIFISGITAYIEFQGTNSKISRYSFTVHKLQDLVLWWQTLQPIEKANVSNIDRLILTAEDLLQREQQAWKSTSQAVKLLSKESKSEKVNKNE